MGEGVVESVTSLVLSKEFYCFWRDRGGGGSNFPHFQRDVINGWPLIWLSYRQGITILGFMKILYQNPPRWYSFKLFSYKNVYWFWFGHHLEMDLTYSNRMRCSISSKCILTKYVSNRAKWIADRPSQYKYKRWWSWKLCIEVIHHKKLFSTFITLWSLSHRSVIK